MQWLLGGYMWLFVHRPFEYYPALGDLQIERVYMIVLLLVWLMSPEKEFRPNRLHGALAAFALAMLACWVASGYRDKTWETIETYLKVVVFYMIVVTTVRDEAGLRRLLAMYLVATGLYMAHSLLEYVHGRYEARMGVNRMIGVDVTYYDSNSFASTLLLAMTMTLPFWKAARGSRRLFLAAGTGTAGLCIFLSGSRAGFLGLVVVGLFLTWSSRQRLRVMLLIVSAVCVGVVALPGSLQDRLMTIIDSSRGPGNAKASAEGRIVGLLDGIKLWERSPAVGVGPGAFGYATGSGMNPHNVYGQVLGEMGSLGVAVFLGLLLAFRANGREARRRAAADGADFPAQVARAVGLAVVLMLVQGLAGHNLYRYTWVWLAAFQAVALGCLRRRPAFAPAARPVITVGRPRLATA
jgi:O-antigen ligase